MEAYTGFVCFVAFFLIFYYSTSFKHFFYRYTEEEHLLATSRYLNSMQVNELLKMCTLCFGHARILQTF